MALKKHYKSLNHILTAMAALATGNVATAGKELERARNQRDFYAALSDLNDLQQDAFDEELSGDDMDEDDLEMDEEAGDDMVDLNDDLEVEESSTRRSRSKATAKTRSKAAAKARAVARAASRRRVQAESEDDLMDDEEVDLDLDEEMEAELDDDLDLEVDDAGGDDEEDEGVETSRTARRPQVRAKAIEASLRRARHNLRQIKGGK